MKKFISLVLMILLYLSIVPMTDASIKASATSKTQDEAIAWVQSQVGKSIDTDGYPSGQPYQCVDLIKAYYSYLGVSPVSGNGADYATNFLPSGWQRLQGAQPQKGDILVYTGGYGHVAIYESDRVHYHQNFDNKYYVTKVTYKYNGLSNSYWGVIRPNWSSTPVEPTYFTALWHGDIGETNARIDASINLTYIQQCGFYYGTGTSNMARVIEDTYANTLNIWFDFNEYGITLSPGTTYYYKIFIVVNGNEYQTATQYFTTTGHSHSYNSSVTTQPTCTKEGVRTYKCSCGASYTETIAKTAHNSNTTIPAVAATCTKTGLTEGKKCSVCGTVTVAQQTVAKTSHTYGSWEVTKTATCTVAGTRQKVCTACGNTVSETVKALGHTFGSYKSDNNATYKDDGTKTAYCSRCTETKTVSDPGSRLVVKKPYTVKVEQNASAIRLTWNKCEGATGYRIYYKVGSTWKIALNATTKTTHTFTGLKSGTSFTLAIRPYVIANGSVIWSDYLTVTASTAPVAPVAKASSPSKGRITVSWNNVAGGQKYQLFYKSGNGGYKLYNTYDKVTSLTFKNLKSGTRFTFAVRAYRTVGGRTIYSSYTPVSVTVK